MELLNIFGTIIKKANPFYLYRNPTLQLLEVVLVLCIGWLILYRGTTTFELQVTLWIGLTLFFSLMNEAIAERRGKAESKNLQGLRTQLTAKRLNPQTGGTDFIPAANLVVGDIIFVEQGDMIPSDGVVIDGIASIDESAITGESAPVIREPAGDRAKVTGGTRVLSDWIKVRITTPQGQTALDKMIGLIEGSVRQKTPNEIALGILLSGFTLVFIYVVVDLHHIAQAIQNHLSIIVLGALFVTLIPTTICGLLSAIGIAGMNRLMHIRVIATSGRAVEAAGDVDILLLDKTGTITFGNRKASEFISAPDVAHEDLVAAAYLASIQDTTPEGQSILELAVTFIPKDKLDAQIPTESTFVPFSAQTRISGLRTDGHSVYKGSVEAITKQLRLVDPDYQLPPEIQAAVHNIGEQGGTPLAVTVNAHLMGVIYLKDIVKPDIYDKMMRLRAMGIKPVMLTGDNPITARTIAKEAGIDDVIAEATPESKLNYIREKQALGHRIAMCGDGTNDAPALSQADVAVAMDSGTQAAKEASNLIDLDSDPTKLSEVVVVGKQMLITRGALTAFSLANDVAKYFAILPAMYIPIYPQLSALDIMDLGSPEAAILSAVIFNSLIIIALLPLALWGVRLRQVSAKQMLRTNVLVYGLGGLITPFLGIKGISYILQLLGIV